MLLLVKCVDKSDKICYSVSNMKTSNTKKKAIQKLLAKKESLIMNGIASQKTLLTRFIMEKDLNYEEPQREGTPKGNAIGFSKNKHYAALWMLKNKKLQDVAKLLEISYGVVRNWNTEKEFKDLVTKYQNEFVRYFSKYLFDRIDTGCKFQNELRKKTAKELSVLDLQSHRSEYFRDRSVSPEMLSDIGEYSDLLTSLILSHMESLLEAKITDENNLVLFGEVSFILYSFGHYQGFKDKELKEKNTKLEAKISSTLIYKATDILSQPKITNNDKKEVIVALKCLEQLKVKG